MLINVYFRLRSILKTNIDVKRLPVSPRVDVAAAEPLWYLRQWTFPARLQGFECRVRLEKERHWCCAMVVKWKFLVQKKSKVLSNTMGEYAPSCLHSHRNDSSTREETTPPGSGKRKQGEPLTSLSSMCVAMFFPKMCDGMYVDVCGHTIRQQFRLPELQHSSDLGGKTTVQFISEDVLNASLQKQILSTQRATEENE